MRAHASWLNSVFNSARNCKYKRNCKYHHNLTFNHICIKSASSLGYSMRPDCSLNIQSTHLALHLRQLFSVLGVEGVGEQRVQVETHLFHIFFVLDLVMKQSRASRMRTKSSSFTQIFFIITAGSHHTDFLSIQVTFYLKAYWTDHIINLETEFSVEGETNGLAYQSWSRYFVHWWWKTFLPKSR